MIKFTSNNDFDFGCNSVQLLRDTSKDLEKRASSKDLFKNIKKDPKQEDIHVIALGAYESTGCFFKGAPVQTISGIKPIEEVKVGDLVLTHRGRYRPVTATFQEEYEGDCVALDITNMPDEIKATSNHPFSILRSAEFQTKHRCPSLLDPADSPIDILDNILESKLQFVAAKDIQPGDYVVTPVTIDNEENHKEYTEDDAYLFGYYLAEGCLVKEYRPTRQHCGEYIEMLFTMAVNDAPCIEKLQTIIENLNGNRVTVQPSYTSEFGRRITFQNYEKAQECLKLFGCQSTTKHISPLIFSQSLDWKLKFLSAYFDGDGCLISDDTKGLARYIGTMTASTASRNLAYDLQRLLASCGITSSVFQGMNKHSNGCFGKCDHVIYQVSIGLSHSNKILEYCKRLAPVNKEARNTNGRTWISSNYLVLKVKKVITTQIEAIKYNLEVAEDNTYVVDISGHNSNRNGDCWFEDTCKSNHHQFVEAGRAINRHHRNKPTDPKYGNIKASAYNEKMGRIELVIGLDKDKCAADLDELEKTGNLQVSMAMKTPWDNCSICDFKAKDDRSRCEHIPAKLGEILPDGRMVSMINPKQGRFFELSLVKRGADRIAFGLSKVASVDNPYIKLSSTDYLKLYPDLVVPDDILISKKASDKRDLLHKLSAIEKRVDAIAHSQPTTTKDSYIKTHAHKINKTPAIDDISMDKLRSMDPSMVLKTLADKGVVFSPEDFSKYLFDKRIDKKHVAGMKTHLPTAFRDYEDSGEVVNSEKYEPEHVGKVNPELKTIAGKLHEGHSLEEGPAVRRIMLISISCGSMMPHSPEEKTKEAADQELAKQYTTYKLAALNYLNEQGKLDDELMLNAVLQNQ